MLNKLRQELDQCDQELAKLFRRRLELIAEVGSFKKEQKLPIYVPEREREILNRFTGLEREFFRSLLKLSRFQQSMQIFPFNLVLIGFMGTGKTSTGKLLAEQLGRSFLDLDQMLEEKFQQTIPDFFRSKGEKAFRSAEATLIESIKEQEGVVIATGGGAVLNRENVANLRKKSRLILLTAEPKTIFARLKTDYSRPLLQGADPLARIKELQKERAPSYQRAADLIIPTDRLEIPEVTELILKKLRELED